MAIFDEIESPNADIVRQALEKNCQS